MMMPHLPLDLVEEILFRVPATSFKRLRSTCKLWKALFKTPRFTEKHFGKAAAKESMVLMLKEYRICPVSVNLNVAPPSIEFKGALGLKISHSSSEEVDIVDVFHSDGLLLCTTKDSRVVVWNPCLGETTWIQPKTYYERESRFTLGYIQNNKSCRSYKILRWWGVYDDKRFEIYEFSADSWRVLDDVVLDCVIQCNGYSSGPSSLKGNTYWVATDYKEDYKFVLSFDFSAEKFKRLRLPLFQNDIGNVTLSVGREEQLWALNRSYNPSKIEMWVTNKIDNIESELLWCKSFIVDLPVISISDSFVYTSLLIDAEKKVVLCCNVGDTNRENYLYTIGEDEEYYTELPYINSQCLLENIKWRPVVFNYVPCLFQIK